MNQILITSDQHSNWEALEEIYKKANELKIPLVINGDIVGDYDFDNFRKVLGILYPQEILNYELKQALSKSEKHLSEEEIQELYQKIAKDKQSDLLRHKNYGVKLFYLYVEKAAKKLANLIEKYKVKTYFLLGNHEPLFFQDLVKDNLINKELYVDMNKEKGILKVNGFNICGISNTNALMPHISQIFIGQELYSNFLHQLAPNRKLLTCPQEQFLEQIKWDSSYKEDFDWKRIVNDEENEKLLLSGDLDIFITHGQIGIGKWRDDKSAHQMPTLFVAAAIASYAKLCVDGHLHTSYEMVNAVNIPTIRAVGNKAYLVSKDEIGDLSWELLEFNATYDTRGSEIFEDLEEVKKKVVG